MCVCVCMPVSMCVCVCVRKPLPDNQSFDRKISANEKGSAWCHEGGVMDSDQQLLTSLFDDINWGPLDHASHGPQLI